MLNSIHARGVLPDSSAYSSLCHLLALSIGDLFSAIWVGLNMEMKMAKKKGEVNGGEAALCPQHSIKCKCSSPVLGERGHLRALSHSLYLHLSLFLSQRSLEMSKLSLRCFSILWSAIMRRDIWLLSIGHSTKHAKGKVYRNVSSQRGFVEAWWEKAERSEDRWHNNVAKWGNLMVIFPISQHLLCFSCVCILCAT